MRFRSSTGAILGLILVMTSAPPALGEVTQSDLVLVREGEIITEDLYAVGNRIRVDGRVEGDLVAAAFEEVIIAGEVTGDVIVLSGSLSVTGRVGGSVRVAAGVVEISGVIGDDLVAAAWRTLVDADGEVGRDFLGWGRTASMGGTIGRDLSGRFGGLGLDGEVMGRVDLTVGEFRVGPAARVTGEIGYRSPDEAVIEASDPGGIVIHRTPLRSNIRVRALQLLILGLAWLVLLAAGLLIAFLWPEQLGRAVGASNRGWRTWLAGLGVLTLPIIAGAVLWIFLALSPAQAGLPFLVIAVPLIIGLLGLVLLGALAGVVPVAATLGQRIIKRSGLPAAFLVGMVVVGVLSLIPVARWVVVAVVGPLGLGAWSMKSRQQ